jgi:predicted RNase H-like HicB family nuclease/DNA-binding XRE family transcriptional regulator
MVYHFRVHQEDNGFWAECLEIKDCNTQSDSMKGLAESAQEALNLHLSEPENSTIIFPRPKRNLKGRSLIAVAVDPQVAMAMKIRQARLKQGLTQRMAAELLGINHIYAYQKLESAKTCNPGLLMLARLKKVFPGLGVDDAIE